MDPLEKTEGKWNYVLIKLNIETLYGEGRSKYKQKEKVEMDGLKDFIHKTLKLMPPHLNNNPKQFNQKNYDMFMNLLYDFEMKIKDYNDDHGLTTKNKGTQGLFG